MTVTGVAGGSGPSLFNPGIMLDNVGVLPQADPVMLM